MEEKLIGKMTINEVFPHLDTIAKAYGLKLNRLNDFKFAKLILVNLYCRELC
tara:strand:- start:235 stop:390 length:156 start_codon:yes stop_codon:yes gene_type:complete